MSTYPSQEHFNEIHREAHSYGEEGEWLVVAADYTEDEAVEKIKALIDEMHGTKDDTRYDYYDIPGIGMTYAKRLIAHFGHSVLDVINDFPEKLTQVAGIGKLRTEKIISGWNEQKAVRDNSRNRR